MNTFIDSFVTQNAQEEAMIRSLRRAYSEGVHQRFWSLKPLNGETTGWFENAQHVVYLVTLEKCECLAGQHGQMCKHRAALADLTGSLDQLIEDFYLRAFPAPVDPAPAVTIVELVTCQDCNGAGHRRTFYGGRMADYITHDCPRCSNTGCVLSEARDLAVA